jgi:nucleotide-binding universal stress UspA family protein
MFKKILIATDGSECSRKAIEQAVALAKDCGATLVAVTSAGLSPGYPFQLEEMIDLNQTFEQQGRRIVDEVQYKASSANVPCVTRLIMDQAPHKAILSVADEEGCDLLVMGSHGHGGIVALALGSVTHKVLAHAKIPVMVAR